MPPPPKMAPVGVVLRPAVLLTMALWVMVSVPLLEMARTLSKTALFLMVAIPPSVMLMAPGQKNPGLSLPKNTLFSTVKVPVLVRAPQRLRENVLFLKVAVPRVVMVRKTFDKASENVLLTTVSSPKLMIWFKRERAN